MPAKTSGRIQAASSWALDDVCLEELIGFALRRAHFGAENHYARLRGAHGLTPRQISVLLSLAQSGPTTIAELSERIFVDRNTLGEMITRMAKKGLVQKRVPRENRRTVQILIAARGSEALMTAGPLIVESQMEVLSAIPADDRKVLMRCLAIIANRFS